MDSFSNAYSCLNSKDVSRLLKWFVNLISQQLLRIKQIETIILVRKYLQEKKRPNFTVSVTFFVLLATLLIEYVFTKCLNFMISPLLRFIFIANNYKRKFRSLVDSSSSIPSYHGFLNEFNLVGKPYFYCLFIILAWDCNFAWIGLSIYY